MPLARRSPNASVFRLLSGGCRSVRSIAGKVGDTSWGPESATWAEFGAADAFEDGGASRVDDVVLGKDIDGATRMSEHSVYVRFSWAGSAQQFARLAEGAAGTGWHEARTFSPAHSRIVCVTITRCSAGAAGRRCVGALIHGCCSHAISLLGS